MRTQRVALHGPRMKQVEERFRLPFRGAGWVTGATFFGLRAGFDDPTREGDD
ncbi:hypothetical protein C7405_105211 [Paraburkholderia caballeronis]|nr:hypothetical protein C7405_105211 [Paraburkholderia caballeronis]